MSLAVNIIWLSTDILASCGFCGYILGMNNAMLEKDTSFVGDLFYVLGAAIKGAAIGAALFFGLPAALALVGSLF